MSRGFYKKIVFSSLVCFSALIFGDDAGVQPAVAAPAATQCAADSKKDPTQEKMIETTHIAKIGGVDIPYKATIGTIAINDDQQCPKAMFFYVAYTKANGDDARTRPLTFCFNGGPGSSSIWLHIGALGPKKILLNELGVPQKPYRLVDNEYSLLDQSDLVFVDPISTGFSRVAPGQDPKKYYGFDEDIASVAEFIRTYTTKNNRWESPLYLAGESYGTTRAVGLASYLQDVTYMSLNGVILISSVLDNQTLSTYDYSTMNDLGFILSLPTYTSTAWYYKKIQGESVLADKLKEAEEFALNDYALALLQGDQLAEEKKQQIIQKLSSLTGLSTQYLLDANMRVDVPAFMKQLLHAENRIIGRFDTKVEGISVDPCRKNAETDPSSDVIMGGFTATFNDYVRKDLLWPGFEEYKILTNVFPWNYGDKGSNQFLNVSANLRDVMSRNTSLKVFIASGLFDLATPYFATEYTINHLQLDPSIKSNIIRHFYDGGHMMYLYEPTLKKLKMDLIEFYKVAD